MASRRTVLPEAKREIRGIVSYLADVCQSPRAAAAFLDEFERQLDLICANPEMRALSHLGVLAALGYRSAPVGNYLFLYKVLEGRIVVAYVFHQSQDYARLV